MKLRNQFYIVLLSAAAGGILGYTYPDTQPFNWGESQYQKQEYYLRENAVRLRAATRGFMGAGGLALVVTELLKRPKRKERFLTEDEREKKILGLDDKNGNQL